MVDRFYGYQYDTNPKKLSQEYTPFKNRYSSKEDSVYSSRLNQSKDFKSKPNINPTERRNRYKSNAFSKEEEQYKQKENKTDKKRKNNNKNKSKNNIKISAMYKLKIVVFLITSFFALFVISYQNSLISESFNKKEQYKEEMEALCKTNQQLEVNIENSLNLTNIEQVAKEKLGMQKLTNEQKIYVNLPKQDFVAPAVEQVVMEEEVGFFEKIIKGYTN